MEKYLSRVTEPIRRSTVNWILAPMSVCITIVSQHYKTGMEKLGWTTQKLYSSVEAKPKAKEIINIQYNLKQ